MTTDASVSDRPGEAGSLPWLLTETTIIQALGTAAVLTVPALAPAVALTLGVPSSFVGYQVGLVYLAAMLSSLVGGAVVSRWGPCRTGQTAMALTAAGCSEGGVIFLGDDSIEDGYILPLACAPPPPAPNTSLS